VAERPELVVITGMSGAGRSQAGKALEDLGFFVIDNLPANLIARVVEQADPAGDPRRRRLAVAVDTRGGLSFEALEEVLLTLAREGVPTTLLFLDAEDEVLTKRFSESRRPHPVEAATLSESIARERTALQDLRGQADVVVDTSDRSVQELRRLLQDLFARKRPRRPLRVAVVSFGFKHGLPRVVDLLFDVRFLPNPFWVTELRPLTGRDEPVRQMVMSLPDTGEFLSRAEALLEFLLPLYEAEGKSYLTIGVGCTGGRHRAVVVAEELGRWLAEREVEVTVLHRDAER
jgi:RNase adapter protein RapZ